MQPVRVFEILGQVLTSWQVLATTIVLILFLNIVFYVARSYRRPKSLREKKIKFKASKKAPAEAAISSEKDDLGLEESEEE